MHYCIVVPHYRHDRQLAGYLPKLLALGFPVVVVDDGSGAEVVSRLRLMVGAYPHVTLLELPQNGGKGAALVAGMSQARNWGFTHAICVDADGQHELAAVARMHDESRRDPVRVLSGNPVFDEDIPRARLYGRRITNWLARLEAGTATVEDAMCGLRLYPLSTVMPLVPKLRRRMEFDIEILVAACRAGIPVGFVPARVVYPIDGCSHFRMVTDNLRLSRMHARLLAVAAWVGCKTILASVARKRRRLRNAPVGVVQSPMEAERSDELRG